MHTITDPLVWWQAVKREREREREREKERDRDWKRERKKERGIERKSDRERGVREGDREGEIEMAWERGRERERVVHVIFKLCLICKRDNWIKMKDELYTRDLKVLTLFITLAKSTDIYMSRIIKFLYINAIFKIQA